MINKYLDHLQEDNKNLNEFLVISIIFLINHVYKKYTEYKKILQYCSNVQGKEREECIITYKINSLEKAKIEINNLRSKCEHLETNIEKCNKKIDKKIIEIDKELARLKTKLKKLQGNHAN